MTPTESRLAKLLPEPLCSVLTEVGGEITRLAAYDNVVVETAHVGDELVAVRVHALPDLPARARLVPQLRRAVEELLTGMGQVIEHA